MQYLINHGGLVPFDGDGMREYLVDEYVRDDFDPPLVEGLRAGSLLEVPRGEVTSLSPFTSPRADDKSVAGCACRSARRTVNCADQLRVESHSKSRSCACVVTGNASGCYFDERLGAGLCPYVASCSVRPSVTSASCRRKRQIFNKGSLAVLCTALPPLPLSRPAGVARTWLVLVRAKDFVGKRALHEGSARNLNGDGLWNSGEEADFFTQGRLLRPVLLHYLLQLVPGKSLHRVVSCCAFGESRT